MIAAAREAGLEEQLKHPIHHFRGQPVTAAGTAVANFPCYDTFEEVIQTLGLIAASSLDASEPHLILDDLGQCWRIRIASRQGRVGLIEWNWDATVEPDTSRFSFGAAEHACQAREATQRLHIIHNEPLNAFGCNYWAHS